MTEPDEPDTRGWDRARDGAMADYDNIEVGHRIEPYDPSKDPVLKGIAPDPYAGDRRG